MVLGDPWMLRYLPSAIILSCRAMAKWIYRSIKVSLERAENKSNKLI
jgi:hypothetical protein